MLHSQGGRGRGRGRGGGGATPKLYSLIYLVSPLSPLRPTVRDALRNILLTFLWPWVEINLLAAATLQRSQLRSRRTKFYTQMRINHFFGGGGRGRGRGDTGFALCGVTYTQRVVNFYVALSSWHILWQAAREIATVRAKWGITRRYKWLGRGRKRGERVPALTRPAEHGAWFALGLSNLKGD